MTLHLPDCVPSLQTLSLDRVWPIFSNSPTSMTELTCTCTRMEDWSPLLDAVKSCHLIQRLKINSSGYYGNDLIAFPAATGKVVLPSLTLLEIRGLVVVLVPAIGQFLSHCDIPKLESLDVRDQWGEEYRVFEGLCQSVAPHIPGIKSLTVDFRDLPFDGVSRLLNSLIKHPEAFPHLSELSLSSTNKKFKNYCDSSGHRLGEIIRDFLVLREGNISHLTIPPPFLEKNVTESLKKHFPCLEIHQD